MNKSALFGIGMFIIVVMSLLCVSLTTDVNAQSILVNDTNTSLSSIFYKLNITDLNLSNQQYIVYDNTTNMMTATNITIGLDYACLLHVDSPVNNISKTYGYNDSTFNLGEIILVNNTITTYLPDGYYDIVLDCMYYINTTNQTDVLQNNQTNTTKTIVFSASSITIQKTILIDTASPNIVLSNASDDTLYNNIQDNNTNFGNDYGALLNFTVSDISNTVCTANINNGSISIPLNVSVDGIPILDNYATTSIFFGTPTINIFTPNDSFINTWNVLLPINITSGNYSYSISCKDTLYNVNGVNSTLYALNYTQNNSNPQNNSSPDQPFFTLDVSKPSFSLGETGYYIINATNGSNVSITICPQASGWVQCFMVPTFIEDTFPKIQALPYTNKTGRYLIEGVMHFKNQTIIRNVTYETTNTLTASITASESSGVVGDIITFNASASSGVGAYSYRWTMHDGTKFIGTGAYKNYTTAGTYRVNLTVNDSAGNNYTTYFDVIIKNAFTLTVVVQDKKDNTRIADAQVNVDEYTAQTNTAGVATFRLTEEGYRISIIKDNYLKYTDDIVLDKDITYYANLTYQDLTPPIITSLTDNGLVLSKDAVNLKFKAEDTSKMTCSLYTAMVNDSWFTLKDSGDNLLSNTEYTFEVRDLDNGAYKWKIECIDADNNKAYSDERQFIVSDGNITIALQSNVQNSDDINTALDNLNKLSGDESSVADILNIKIELKDLLDRIDSLERDIHDLAYRRDLDANGMEEAQKNLTDRIDYLKYTTPVSISLTDSKTFVKYAREEDLKSTLNDYLSIENVNLDKKLFLESTKLAQSKVIISTRVRNVRLYYLDGRTSDITLVTKDIQAANPEEDLSINNSNSITFLEVIPKTIVQTAKSINMMTAGYSVIKDDPLIEFPSTTRSIIYYFNGTLSLDEFQNTDTILIEKDINAEKSMTGFSILGIGPISDIKVDGKGIMIVIVVLLVLFYLVLNFDIIDKIRSMNLGFIGIGSKKRVSFIRVLINDALDYLKTEDYDKATMIYREIKLSYEEANNYVKKQVYDESYDLCNQMDMIYATQTLDKLEYYLSCDNRNGAMIEFEKLEKTYNKLNEPYQLKISDRFRKVLELIKNRV